MLTLVVASVLLLHLEIKSVKVALEPSKNGAIGINFPEPRKFKSTRG